MTVATKPISLSELATRIHHSAQEVEFARRMAEESNQPRIEAVLKKMKHLLDLASNDVASRS